MKEKIIYLAADERPCNYQHPDLIFNLSSTELVKPPRSMMGYRKKAADVKKIQSWLLDNINRVDQVVLSIELLVFGGILPSRIHNLSKSELFERVEFLKKLKSKNENLKIYAFNLITRVPAYSSSDEEPDYYADYGEEIYKLGFLRDKKNRSSLSDSELEELKNLKNEIPDEIKSDYLARREKNHAVNLKVLGLLEAGVIDFLLFPMDDNSEFGFSAAERKLLLKKAIQKNLNENLMSYPGADESGLVLLSRALTEKYNYHPKVYVRYSSSKGKNIIPPLEDRSLEITLKEQLSAAGALNVDNVDDSDYILFVNTPSSVTMKVMEKWDFLLERSEIVDPERSYHDFVNSMEYYLQNNKKIALADTALINGAEDQLLKIMAGRDLLKNLSAYAGWNTSSNTIGSVIAHANVLMIAEKIGVKKEKIQEKNNQFLLLRYLDDWAYQYQIRAELNKEIKDLDLNYFDLKDKENEVIRLASKKMKIFKSKYLSSFVYDFELSFPWKRLFEIKININ
ncbi:MAG: DUF4127 family protein [Halanaerobium sp.]